MNINWKDFGLMFVIGLIVSLITLVATIILTSFYGIILLTALLGYGISIVFYLWRNKSDILEAAIISFVFGITFVVFFTQVAQLIYMISWHYTISDWISSWGSWIDLSSINLIYYYGIPVMIYGLIIWFVINKLKWEKS